MIDESAASHLASREYALRSCTKQGFYRRRVNKEVIGKKKEGKKKKEWREGGRGCFWPGHLLLGRKGRGKVFIMQMTSPGLIKKFQTDG